MTQEAELRLPSGRACVLRPKPLPLLPTYHILFFPSEQGALTQREEAGMFALAQRVAADLGRRFHGDPGCYAILFSGGRTRRRPWPHFHIVAVPDLRAKRRALFLLHIKQLLIRVARAQAWLRTLRWGRSHV